MARSTCCKNDNCGVIARIFLYICGFVGIVFSLLTLYSCDFLSYSTEQGTTVTALPPPFSVSDTAKVGVFRWEDLTIENSDCVPYDDLDSGDFNSTMKMVQTCAFVSVLCAAVALLIATIEFVCIRFYCSKFFISFFFVCALLIQALTFAIYEAYDFCSGRNCKLGLGGGFSIAAGSCYLISAVLVCATPKPLPWIRRLGDDDDDTGCLACCMKKEPEQMVATKEFAEADMPEADTNDAAAAVAVGAAAGAVTAAAVVAVAANDDDDKDKDEELGEKEEEKKEEPVQEEAPAEEASAEEAPADEAVEDVEADEPKETEEAQPEATEEATKETTDEPAVAAAGEPEDAAPDKIASSDSEEPSQQGEEVPMELANSFF